jgi:hypothetical protein
VEQITASAPVKKARPSTNNDHDDRYQFQTVTQLQLSE